MPPTVPTLSPLLVQRVVEGLKPPVAVVTDTGPPPAGSPPFGSVVVAVSDLVALRAIVADLPALGRARTVGVVVADAMAPLALRIDPRWPALRDLDARLEDGAAVTVARFASRIEVADVLAGIAYADGAPGHAGLLVGRDYDPGATVPLDVVTREGTVEESPVLGRAPVAIADPGPAPLDETLFNPIGFRRDWDRGIVDLEPSWTATPGLVAELRDAQGVRVPADADERVVAALAMSGVPLVTAGDAADLDDPARRELHSVRQSRTALMQHSVFAWRQRLAERAGVRISTYPSEDDVVLINGADTSYGPDVITDLLLARRYSGARVVEMPGGPTLVDRTLLSELGGLDAILAAGHRVFRTHALTTYDESEAP
jgi:hypothetical protein